MRIQSLYMKNVNSFRGEHVVDFGAGALASDDLFLIAGPTGSGKTTILDSVTAALYDRTPRLGSSTRLLKNQSEKDAAIEFRYRVGSDEYLHRWSVDRRDNKKVSVFKNGGAVEGVKASKLAEFTESVVGLDYESFTRTVILAQNRFDEFLKSRPDDRRRIIETISDQRILEDIKNAVLKDYENFRSEYATKKALLDDLRSRFAGLDPAAAERAVSGKSAELSSVVVRAEAARRATLALEAAKTAGEELAAARESLSKITASYDFEKNASRIEFLKKIRDEFASRFARLDELAARKSETSVLSARARAESEETAKYIESSRASIAAMRSGFEEFMTGYHSGIEAARAAAVIIGRISEERAREAAAREKAARALRAIEEHDRRSASEAAIVKKLENDVKALSARLGEIASVAGSEEALQSFADASAARERIRETIQRTGSQINLLESEILECEEAVSAYSADLAVFRVELESLTAARARLQESRAEIAARMRAESLEEASAAIRAELRDGMPCPVCGSLDHPYGPAKTAEHPADSRRSFEEIESAISGSDSSIIALEKKISSLEASMAAADARLPELNRRFGLLCDERARALAAEGRTGPAASVPAALSGLAAEEILPRWRALLSEYGRESTRLSELGNSLERSRAFVESAASARIHLESSLGEASDEVSGTAAAIAEMNEKALSLTGGVPPEAVARELEENKMRYETDVARLESGLRKSENDIAALASLAAKYAEDLSLAEKLLSSESAALGRALETCRFTEAEARSGLASLSGLNDEERRFNEMASEKKRLEQIISARENAVAAVFFSEAALLSARELENSLAEEAATLNRELGALASELSRAKKCGEELAASEKEFENFLDVYADAEGLYLLTKDNSFRDYVLGHYLKMMLAVANVHLKKLTDGRYEFTLDPKSGREIFVRDYFNEGREREASTISGGEGFMASLSLALALSQISSGDRSVGFMFLDEGFGMLDPDSLEDVLDMILNLKYSGRKIGVISHVAQVRERISARIEIVRKPDGGSSIKI